MAKTKLSEYNSTASSNTDVANINIGEGMLPSNVNNAMRAIMGHLKDFVSGTSGDTLTSAAIVATTADINGGTIDATTIGASTAAAGSFTALTASGAAVMSSTLAVTGASTFSSTLVVSGAATFSSTAVMSGDVTFGGAIDEKVYDLSGTEINPSNGTIQYKTLSGATTFTDALVEGESVTLMIDDGTAYTVAWPTMTWVNNGGIAPTLATSGYTTVSLWKVSSTLYGALVGNGA